MKWIVVAGLVLHGLVHGLGFAGAFRLIAAAPVEVSRPAGVVWLVAALVLISAAGLLAAGSPAWVVPGAAGLLLSQVLIATMWREAWAGTILNVVLSIPVALAWGMDGPLSFRDQFTREAARRAAAAPQPSRMPVTEAELAHLPVPVQRYLRMAGVVGRERPRTYRLTMSGRIRGSVDDPWMPFAAEQFSAVDGPVRLFYMRARRSGVPVAVLHRYVAGVATMQVRLAGLFPLASAEGPVMDRSETVTVFNDMCLLAPGTLLDSRITWRERDASTVEATFTAGGQTVRATLAFDAQGLLASFVSPDRARASADGRSFTPLPFVTPVSTHGVFDGVVLAGAAEGQWRLSDGQVFTYAEFRLDSARFNRWPDR